MRSLSHTDRWSGARGNEERERLILEHMPRVDSLARRIHRRLPRSVAVDDLVSAGTLGLISAVDGFDPARGVKLSTYAEYKIRGAILDSLRRLDWAPRRERLRAREMDAAVAALQRRVHRSPEPGEVALQMGLEMEEYHRRVFRAHRMRIARLEMESGPEASPHQDLVDTNEISPSAALERSEEAGLLLEAIQKLPRQQRIVLYQHYIEELRLCEISKRMSLSPARISKIRAQGLLHLRRYWAQRSRNTCGASG